MKKRSDQVCIMRDGTRLRHDLYLPDEPGRRPVLLVRTPYGKRGFFDEPVFSRPELFVDAGYAIAVQDVRGTGESEGALKSTGENEFSDGRDTVEALSREPYCSGSVGMYGLSYFGFTQLAAAESAPTALRCACPFQIAGSTPFGGDAQRTVNLFHMHWLYAEALANVGRLPPEQQARARQQLTENQARLPELLRERPLRRTSAANVPEAPLLRDFGELVDHVEDPAFWTRIHRPIDYARMKTPMLHLTGWFDVALTGTVENYAALQAHPSQWLVIGPWCHGGALAGELEGESFGPRASGDAFGVPMLMKRFFDAFLSGDEHAMDGVPRVQYFQMGENAWREADAWPPKESREAPLYLSGNGLLSAVAPDVDTLRMRYDYDPDAPFPAEYEDEQSRRVLSDQRALLSRPDALAFRTEPLARPLPLTGRLRARLFAQSSAPDTDFACVVYDEAPDGTARKLAQGLTRARFRDGSRSAPLAPDRVEAFPIELGPIARTLEIGHRLTVVVTSSLYPLHDANLNDGLAVGQGAIPRVARQTLRADREHPSALYLPVLRPAE